MKDLKRPNGTGAGVDAGGAQQAARMEPRARQERRWSREVLRRSLCELLYLGSTLAIAGGALFWLYELLTRRPALKTGLMLAVAIAVSMAAYHFARWRAAESMSRQVEKCAVWLIAALGMALVWGGICFAFTFGACRWFSAPGITCWIIGAATGLCGFTYMMAGEWSDLRDCLALPAASSDVRHDESMA